MCNYFAQRLIFKCDFVKSRLLIFFISYSKTTLHAFLHMALRYFVFVDLLLLFLLLLLLLLLLVVVDAAVAAVVAVVVFFQF